MSASPHRLLLASAGTGKTWQLTGRFLQLLFEGVPAERILATTFTRKAAGEILDRVLRRLVEALEDPDKLAELGAQVGRDLDEAEVRALLASATRRLDRFRVRTLDAFFVHLARLFALDLGLPPDWGIVDEASDNALRSEAVATALSDADSQELLALLRELHQADASRSVERVLIDKVGQGRDAFLDSRPEAWDRIVAPRGLSDEELATARSEIEALELPTTAKGSPRLNWIKARDAILGCVDRRDWEKLVAGTLVARILQNEPEFDRAAIEPAHREAIVPLLQQAAHVLIASVARENRAARQWLERFEIAYERAKREERAFRFEDLPKALHPRDERRIESQDLVWYRLDGRIDHLLLDEFQDTAPVQWRILEHMASEILADGTGERSFFCVGDVKQSIYGWREAEPRLLADLAGRYPVLEPEPLNESYRSSKVILETVARVFSGIGSNAALKEPGERLAAARDFEADFDEPCAAKELPGAAWLLEARAPDEDEDENDPALELAAERTRAIRDEAPLATIGILLRRNSPIPKLIHLLRQRGIRASGEGGNALTDSLAVLHLVSLLHLADHPGDSAAAFHVASSPLGPHVGLTPEGFAEQAEEVAAVVRKRLAAEDYGGFCASLTPVVAAEYGTWDRRRFDQLVDEAHAFEARAGLRADAFVDHVRGTRVEDPSANLVKVMTVHAAKGLEFDAVLLPELDLPFSPHDTPLLLHRPDPAGLIAAVSHSRSRAVSALDASPGGLKELRAQQKKRETRESLCLLYVALTRARHRLDLIVHHRQTPGKAGKTFAGVVCDALAPGRVPDGRGVVWEHPENDAPWYPAQLARTEPGEMQEGAEALRLDDLTEARTPLRRTPSAQEGDGRLDPRDLLRSPSAPARVRGSLVHRWMEEVEWIEDFERSDEELLALAQGITPERRIAREALTDFRAHLERPGVRAALARPDGEAEVWRERAFALRLAGESGETELWSGSFDRVVLRKGGGELVRARVIDFKTDRVRPADVEQRVEFYRPQLEGYRRVVAGMTGLPEDAIEASLLFLQLDLERIVGGEA